MLQQTCTSINPYLGLSELFFLKGLYWNLMSLNLLSVGRLVLYIGPFVRKTWCLRTFPPYRTFCPWDVLSVWRFVLQDLLSVERFYTLDVLSLKMFCKMYMHRTFRFSLSLVSTTCLSLVSITCLSPSILNLASWREGGFYSPLPS